MNALRKLFYFGTILSFTINTIAGGIPSPAQLELQLPPAARLELQLPKPLPPLSGFYIGAGLSINSLTASNTNVSIDLEPALPFAPLTLAVPFHNTDNNFHSASPVFQFGFWSHPLNYHSAHQIYWGAELLYTYIGKSKQTVLIRTDSSSNISLENKINSEFAILANLGIQLSQKVYTYLGAGIAMFPNVEDTILPTPGNQTQISNTLFGGIGQIGLTAQLSQHWFINCAFAHAQTSSQVFTERGSTHSLSLSINQVLLMIDFHFHTQ